MDTKTYYKVIEVIYTESEEDGEVSVMEEERLIEQYASLEVAEKLLHTLQQLNIEDMGINDYKITKVTF